MSESERRIVDLQTRIAFQEDAIHELSRTVVRQGNDIEAMRREIETLRGQIRDLAAAGVAGADEPPPPHY
jgi:SlyX protein